MMVSTKVYVVVTEGFTVALELVELNPDGTDDQLYVLPKTDAAPMEALCPRQIVELLPAFAAGSGLTVIVTLCVLVHPVAVMVSTRV